MVQIAMVDDVPQEAQRLSLYLDKYAREHGVEITAKHYASAELFLTDYHAQFDLVFMDIRMGGMDGMQAARLLRERDATVLLIFLTSLAQYAVEGYEVDALDYILKPVSYPALELKLHRALARCRRDTPELVITTGSDTLRISTAELIYVEVFEHHLQYKTTSASIHAYGTLKEVEKVLPASSFFRLNNQTIVNLRYVTRISGSTAWVEEKPFDISRMRKKEFLAAFHRHAMGE